MKKIIATFLAIIMLALAGCSNGVSQSEYDAIVKERDQLAKQLNESQSASSQISQSQSNPKEQEEKIGTRKSPAKIGDIISGTMESVVYGNAELEISLDKVVRGEEAEKIVKDDNQFNELPSEGKEYVIATFTVRNTKDLSSDDFPLDINGAQFLFSNSKFSMQNDLIFIYLNDALNAKLYEGADTTGTVVFSADKGDDCYAVFMDTIWFSLS